MKITKETLRRGIRTFFQTFFSTFVVAGMGIAWQEVDVLPALLGIVLSSIFAGLGALYMNLEKEGYNE